MVRPFLLLCGDGAGSFHEKGALNAMQRIKKEMNEFRLLIRSVPTIVMTMFVMAVFSMNLLANKSLSLPFDWLALDCGILVSWFVFFTMDVVTKHFGPKGATELSILATLLNLVFCLLFFVGSKVPGVWGESFVPGSEALLNNALDQTFGGTWYVLAGSTAAFLVSAFVNNFLNALVGAAFRKNPDGLAAYISRSYLSTAVGQFTDNLVFALLVSHVFFGWSLLQCVTCALTGMVAELLCEVLFTGFGFRLCRNWQRNGVGKEYLESRKGKEAGLT